MATLQPCGNIVVHTCQIEECDDRAKFDAKSKMGPWAYMCLKHLRTHGPLSIGLISNITESPIEIAWIR